MTDTERKLVEYILYIAEKVQTGNNSRCPVCGFYICPGVGCIVKDLRKMLEEE